MGISNKPLVKGDENGVAICTKGRKKHEIKKEGGSGVKSSCPICFSALPKV